MISRILYSVILCLISILAYAMLFLLIMMVAARNASAAQPTYTLSVIIDSGLSDTQGTAAVQQAIDDAARVYNDELKTTLKVADVSSGIDVSADEQPIYLLQALKAYRRATPTLAASDVTVLFTARNLHIGDVGYQGYATTGPVCTSDSVAVVMINFNADDGVTLAHELAHTLGVPHDGYGQCTTTSPTGFIMAAFGGGQHFSACSLVVATQAIASASCMSDTPAPVVQLAPETKGGGSIGQLFLCALGLLVFGRILAGRIEP